MAKKISAEEASEEIICQTWVLKVSIHCQGCKRKVKKVLQGIDGVYRTSIDSQQQRVTVIGNIGVQTLIKKLKKAGKHAEIWPEKMVPREKGETMTTHMPKNSNGGQNGNDLGPNSTVGFTGKILSDQSPVKFNPGDGFTTVNKKGSGSANTRARIGGKMKRKGKNGDNSSNASSSSATPAGTGYQNQNSSVDHAVGPSNLTPTHQHSIAFPCPQGFYIPQVCATCSSMAHLGENHVPLYSVWPSLYTHANGHQATPLDSFNIFSDENIDGCSIV